MWWKVARARSVVSWVAAVSLLPVAAPFGRFSLSGTCRSSIFRMASSCPPQLVCDYLVVGGGATGMAFVDSLLHHHPEKPSVVIVDKHVSPGGHWHDSYSFVRLHQPSAMYGVESERLETGENAAAHRATRQQILDYYKAVQHKLGDMFDLRFVGGAQVDLTAPSPHGEYALVKTSQMGVEEKIVVKAKKLVDARFLEPDLPVFVGPKFKFNPEKVNVVPVNSLADNAHKEMIGDEELPGARGNAEDAENSAGGLDRYVVIGAGKTGMDAIVYLQTSKNVKPEDIMWVMPHDAWITARESIASCMEYLNACVKAGVEQRALGSQVPRPLPLP